MVFYAQIEGSKLSPTISPDSMAEKAERLDCGSQAKITKLLHDRATEYTVVNSKGKPLNLLHLPVDLLKLIIKDVAHTNDLTALALTHSILYCLAIPHIYSRFDIVWPDIIPTTNLSTDVDALTFGLATFCGGNSFRNYGMNELGTCDISATVNGERNSHPRLTNNYPQYTRTFSISNGPREWVNEYLITKASGKMLGTLVAIAVARMTNLENFIWDMPTGVISDVWLALSSLQKKNTKEKCKLERVWVRWHDNSESVSQSTIQNSNSLSNSPPQILAGATTMSSIGWKVPVNSTPTATDIGLQPIKYAQSRVEYPTLSVLPPIKCLSVLDIDELEYLDEMSVLISNSKHCLRVLRVGISSKAENRDFTIAWDGTDLHQIDYSAHWPGASTIGQRRLGGVLGVLLGRVYNIRKELETGKNSSNFTSTTSIPLEVPQIQSQSLAQASVVSRGMLSNSVPGTFEIDSHNNLNEDMPLSEADLHNTESSNLSLRAHRAGYIYGQRPPGHFGAANAERRFKSSPGSNLEPKSIPKNIPSEMKRLDSKLQIHTLELERVPLSIAVLQNAFDWSIMTNLTILGCTQHENLWEMLRNNFAPTSPLPHSKISLKNIGISKSSQYRLNLKKIHTDAVTPTLISFLKETLAPNTLETLFLQDRKCTTPTSVTIDAIYRGPLRRHRSSLRKLILDSSDKALGEHISSSESTRWMAWMPNRGLLNFLTSGHMSNLQELSIAINYKDWHHFLQRLPRISHLHSLNVPFIANHVITTLDSRELALQIVDVIFLRPEIELCYIGILNKCYEVIESKHSDMNSASVDMHLGDLASGPESVTINHDEHEDEDDSQTATSASVSIDLGENGLEISQHSGSDSESFECPRNETKHQLRLREILFYEDKVAIFSARHGRL
ncbi:F-box domain-containing protein [Golovinomyces cichoracearum]|uniref:F-box domain-containing protein n=1 Tax=Golovinomyces cichoracearum TaxID=62708 RepID=A0A420HI97_9PEZI|nr:F-box domain-containing protein [Golovinomyces cichoracearum]